MSEQELWNILNRFLFLEEGQVVFYSTLAEKTDNEELNRGLKRLAAIEADHVENIKEKLFLHYGKKKPVNPVRTTIIDTGLNLFGGTIGLTEGVVGLKKLIEGGVLAETQAIKDYRKALIKIRDPELRDMLWDHLIDEELHLLWLKEQAKKI